MRYKHKLIKFPFLVNVSKYKYKININHFKFISLSLKSIQSEYIFAQQNQARTHTHQVVNGLAISLNTWFMIENYNIIWSMMPTPPSGVRYGCCCCCYCWLFRVKCLDCNWWDGNSFPNTVYLQVKDYKCHIYHTFKSFESQAFFWLHRHWICLFSKKDHELNKVSPKKRGVLCGEL